MIWLAYVWDDWAIPWAGIGALLMGTGSLLDRTRRIENRIEKGGEG